MIIWLVVEWGQLLGVITHTFAGYSSSSRQAAVSADAYMAARQAEGCFEPLRPPGTKKALIFYIFIFFLYITNKDIA